jgi:RNA polymerase sigma factor (sigma-70 family)
VTQSEEAIADWLARCVLPREAVVRAWLRRAELESHEIDDIIQEAYARIAALGAFSQISNPEGYFLRVARNILFDQLRRSRVVRIDTFAELEFLNVRDEGPDPEDRMSAKQELQKLKNLLDDLPDRCRQMFIMRKVEGLSQKEIGKRLGVTENTVETQVQRGLHLVLKAWATGTPQRSTAKEERNGDSKKTRENARE